MNRPFHVLSSRSCRSLFIKLISNNQLNVFYSKKTTQKQKLRDSTVYDVHSSETITVKQAYVFGFSATGALGVERFIAPTVKTGLKNTIGVSKPTRLTSLSARCLDPISVSCGYGFTIYICRNSQRILGVYGCGINTDGQLGVQFRSLKGMLNTGHSVDVVPEPSLISFNLNDDEQKLYRPSQLACGRAHSIVLFENASEKESLPPLIFSLGNNAFGQCGREIIPNEKFTQETAIITRVSLPREIVGIKQIVCGQDHSLLLSSDGKVYSCGLGTDGQTGLGHFNSVDRFSLVGGELENQCVKLLASRGDTVLALTDSGQLYVWGNNEYSQIWPMEQQLQVPFPVKLDLDNCIVPDESGLDPKEVKIGEIKSIACAGSMCCIVNSSGHVFVWGFGCIGLGPKTNFSPRPTLIPPGLFVPAIPDSPTCLTGVTSGLHHFIVQNNNGLLWSWGAPRAGLYCLGLGSQVTKSAKDQTYPLPLLLPVRAIDVCCGVDHTVVLGKSFVIRPQSVRLECSNLSIDEVWKKRNAYDVLGVKRTATTQEIRTAYYLQSKRVHPDSCSGRKNAENFHLVSAAYLLLKDPHTRMRYDEYLKIDSSIPKSHLKEDVDREFIRAREIFKKYHRISSRRNSSRLNNSSNFKTKISYDNFIDPRIHKLWIDPPRRFFIPYYIRWITIVLSLPTFIFILYFSAPSE